MLGQWQLFCPLPSGTIYMLYIGKSAKMMGLSLQRSFPEKSIGGRLYGQGGLRGKEHQLSPQSSRAFGEVAEVPYVVGLRFGS